jgi:hypothetical protein
MFIVTTRKLTTAPAEPHVAAARRHCAPPERDFSGRVVGYKHLAAPRPDQHTNSRTPYIASIMKC